MNQDRLTLRLTFDTKKPKYVKHFYSLIRELGSDASLLLSEFISQFLHFEEERQLLEDKWFFQKRDDIEEKFGWSEFKQRGLIKILEDKGLIESKFFEHHMPRKRYYTIIESKIVEILAKES